MGGIFGFLVFVIIAVAVSAAKSSKQRTGTKPPINGNSTTPQQPLPTKAPQAVRPANTVNSAQRPARQPIEHRLPDAYASSHTAAAPSVDSARHTVSVSTGGEHAHMETSMTGNIPCPPPKGTPKPASAAAAAPAAASIVPTMNAQDALRGMLYAEILGKPKALRHGR